MRTDRRGQVGPTVEFLAEDPEPSAGGEARAAAGPVRERAVLAGGLLVAVLVFAVVGHEHGRPTARPKRAVSAPSRPLLPTARPTPAARVATGYAGWPSSAITKAFATDLPGSIVISEHTSLTDRGRELHLRTIRAVTGNVVLDIVVARPAGPLPSHATRIMQGGYAVTIRSTGFYPPTRRQLDRLAGDRRLTAVV